METTTPSSESATLVTAVALTDQRSQQSPQRRASVPDIYDSFASIDKG